MFDEPIDVPMKNCCEIDMFLCWVWILKKIEFFLFTELYSK